MKAQLVAIYDRGVLADERLHFKILLDAELSYFAVLDTTYIGQSTISSGHHSGYWFQPKAVKAGENVVIYTRSGTSNLETRADGSRYHFFFRGLQAPLYTNPAACAVLFELQTWSTTSRA